MVRSKATNAQMSIAGHSMLMHHYWMFRNGSGWRPVQWNSK